MVVLELLPMMLAKPCSRREVVVRADRAEVVAVAREHDAGARLARHRHRFLERAHADQRAHAAIAVQARDGGRDALDADVGARLGAAALHALRVRLEPIHAVRVHAEEIPHHQDARGVLGILAQHAETLEHAARRAR